MSNTNASGDQTNSGITAEVKPELGVMPNIVETVPTAEMKKEIQNVDTNAQKVEDKVICPTVVETKKETSDQKPNEDKPRAENQEVKKNEVENEIPQEKVEKSGDLDRIQNENTNMKIKIQNLERDLQVRTEERENYKNKVHMLETEVTELKNQQPNTLNASQQNAVDKMKKHSEEILTRAKGVIFDKTKLIKHQELQIETLTLQIASLKEVLTITKELLNIRNLEVKELEEKMQFMEQKINGEKIRQQLMNSKMDTMMKMNTDLKTEYQEQLQLFNNLRTSYARRDELEKEQQQQGNSSQDAK